MRNLINPREQIDRFFHAHGFRVNRVVKKREGERFHITCEECGAVFYLPVLHLVELSPYWEEMAGHLVDEHPSTALKHVVRG